MISIVTITFNNPEELKRTLESLPIVNFIESVVINGGDSQETFNYLESHYGKVINERDLGIADAFNKGIKNSSGDSVMFINSGDILIDKEYLKEANQILSNKPEIDFVHSNILFKDLTEAELLMKPNFKSLGRGMPYLHPTMIFRKKIFNEIGNFNINYNIAMDFDFVVRMEKRKYQDFYKDKGPVVVMEGRGKSAIQEWSAIKECYRSLKENELLTSKNLYGLLVRIIHFFLRKIFLIAGGRKYLKLLKEKKYSVK